MSNNDYTIQLTYGTPINQKDFVPAVTPIIKPTPFNPDILVSVHANWQENNPEGNTYVQNRTHWKEEVEGETVYHKLDTKFLPNCYVDDDEETLVVI